MNVSAARHAAPRDLASLSGRGFVEAATSRGMKQRAATFSPRVDGRQGLSIRPPERERSSSLSMTLLSPQATAAALMRSPQHTRRLDAALKPISVVGTRDRVYLLDHVDRVAGELAAKAGAR